MVEPIRHPASSHEVVYTEQELQYLKAVDDYCTESRRRFLTCREYLAIAHSLGWRQVAKTGELPKFKRGS